jgi:hypothetical protein
LLARNFAEKESSIFLFSFFLRWRNLRNNP